MEDQELIRVLSEELHNELAVSSAKRRRAIAVCDALLAWWFVAFLLSSPFWINRVLSNPFFSSMDFQVTQFVIALAFAGALVVSGGRHFLPPLKLSAYARDLPECL